MVKETSDSSNKIQNKPINNEHKRLFFTLDTEHKQLTTNTQRPYSSSSSHHQNHYQHTNHHQRNSAQQSPFEPALKFTRPIYPLKDASRKPPSFSSPSSLSSSASSTTSSSFKSCSNLKLTNNTAQYLKSTMSDPMFKHNQHMDMFQHGSSSTATATLAIDDDRRNAQQVLTNAHNTIKAMEKMSLQDAFATFKYDLIARSLKRQKEIELRAKQRQNFIDYERKLAELNTKNKSKGISRSSYSASNVMKSGGSNGNNRENYFEINDVHKQKRRVMSAQEIKEMTKKNYSKLPEVKQKQVKQRLEQTKKLNLIKSSIYKKVSFFSSLRIRIKLICYSFSSVKTSMKYFSSTKDKYLKRIKEDILHYYINNVKIMNLSLKSFPELKV